MLTKIVQDKYETFSQSEDGFNVPDNYLLNRWRLEDYTKEDIGKNIIRNIDDINYKREDGTSKTKDDLIDEILNHPIYKETKRKNQRLKIEEEEQKIDEARDKETDKKTIIGIIVSIIIIIIDLQ